MENSAPRLSEIERGSLKQIVEDTISLKALTTQANYKSILKRWLKHLGVEEVEDAFRYATPLQAGLFVRRLEKLDGQKPTDLSCDIKLSHATIRKYVMALKGIYDSVDAEGFPVKVNPFSAAVAAFGNKRIRQKRPTQIVPFELVMPMIELPSPDEKRGVRDRGIMALLFATSGRRKEISILRLCDIGRQGEHVFLKLRLRKSKNDDDNTLPDWAVPFLNELVAQRIKEGAVYDSPLFVSYLGGIKPGTEPFHHSSVYNVFVEIAERFKLPKGTAPHAARATVITKLLSDNEMSYEEIRQVSGHASVLMIEAYDKRRSTVETHPGKKISFR